MVQAYAARIEGALAGALTNAKSRGELRPEVSARDEARLLTSMLVGFWAMKRAGLDIEMFSGAVRAMCRNLERMRS